MAIDMKEEFEAYVKKLTTAIFKDILLEKMEELYSKYEDEYEKYLRVSGKVLLASESLQNEVKKADKMVKDIDSNSKMSLQNISQDIIKLDNNTKTLFEEMRELNSINKYDFITELSNYIEKYKAEVERVLVAGCVQISDKLAGIITPELLQKFIDKLEENTRASKSIATYINDSYKIEVEQNIKKIISDSRDAQEKINSEINAHVSKVLSDAIQYQENFVAKHLKELIETEKSDRNQAIKKQVELVKQIGLSDEQMNELNSRVVNMEQIVKKIEMQNELSSRELQETIKNHLNEQKALDQKRRTTQDLWDKRAENLSWKIYMAFSNTALICLFILLVILQKPWEIIGIQYSCIIAGVLFIIILLVGLLRRKIAKAVAKWEEKKTIKANQFGD